MIGAGLENLGRTYFMNSVLLYSLHCKLTTGVPLWYQDLTKFQHGIIGILATELHCSVRSCSALTGSAEIENKFDSVFTVHGISSSFCLLYTLWSLSTR